MAHKNLPLLAFGAALLALASAALAQTNNYTGATGSSWATGSNWSQTSIPTSSQNVFSANGTEVRIQTTTAAVAGNLTIGGASGTSTVTLRNDTSNSLTVSGNITLAPGVGNGQLSLGTGAQNFMSTLTIGGGTGSILDGGGAGASRIAVFGHMGTLGLSSVTVDNLNINQNSSGSLTIGSGQTYTIGTTSVGSASASVTDALTVNGTLVSTTINPGASTANGTNGATFTLNTGGLIRATTIQRTGSQTTTFNWNGGTIQNKSASNLTVDATSGTLTISLAGTGTHTFEADSGQTITVASTAVLADQAGQNGTLTKSGLGTLTLNGTNTYTGTTSINAGTVLINNASALGNGGNITFGGGALQYGTVTTDFSSRLKNSNSAILIDTNNNNVTFASAIDSSNVGGLTKNGSGTLTLDGSNTYTGATSINAGTLATSAADRITDSSAVTVGSGAVLQLGGSETVGSIAGAGNYSLGAYTLTAGGDNTSTTASGVLSGTGGGLTKAGSGTLTLNGTNTYTGTTSINAGTVLINNASALGSGGNVTFGGGGLQYGTGITTDLSSRLKNSASAILIDTNNNVTFTSAIDSSNSGGLTKNGTGTLTFTGSNTYTGLTTINAGTLSLASSAANNSTISGDILVLAGGTLATTSANNHQIADTSNITISGGTFDAGIRSDTINSITLTSGNLTKATNTLTTASASVFSGGALALTSSGTLSLGASSTFNGTAVTLSGNASRLVTSGTTTLGTGSFVYNNATSSDSAKGWYLQGDVSVLPSATVNFTNANTGSGRITLVSSTKVFDLGSGSDMNIAWSVDGTTPGLTKNGTGTLTLSAANTYAGTTTINNGTLVLNGSNTASAITINSGTLAGTGSGGATTVAAGGRISPGGASVGTLATTTLTLNGTGGYIFSIDNVAGSAGTNWDLINVGGGSGAVAINATSGSPFTIFLNGTPTGWDNSGTYAWDIISSSNVTGFSADKFAFDLSGFNGNVAPPGSFYMTNSASALVLNYSAQAQSNSFIGATGSQWSTSANWSLNSVPTSSQDVLSANGTEARIGGTTAAVAGNLTIGGSSGTSIVSLRNDSLNSLTVSRNITLAPGAGAATLRLGTGAGFMSTLTIGGGSGSILDGGGAGATTIEVYGHMGTLGLANATADNLYMINNNSGSLTIGSGQTYTIGTTRVGSATANVTHALTVNGTLVSTTINLGYSAASGTNDATFTLNDGGLIQATTLRRPGSQNITFNWNGGTIQNESASNLTVDATSGTLTIGLAGTGTHTFEADSGRTITVASTAVLADQAGQNGTLTKSGLGTLTLNSTNTYTGTTSINAGTVLINNASALGNGGNITFGGGALQYGTGITTDLSSRLKNSASAILIDTNNNNVTFASAIDSSNVGGLTKNGSGTLTLDGSNTYTGTTTVNAGTLALGNVNALQNSTLDTGSSGSQAVTLTVAGTNTYNLGGLQGADALAIGANTISVGANNASTTFSGAISSTGGGLTKTGTGTLTLSAANTHTGATVVNTGTLAAAHASALGGNTTVQVNGGSLLVTADDAINGKNITLASTATGGASAASLAFSGTYNGSVGALTLSQDSIIDLGTGSVFVHFSELAMGLSHTLAIYNWTGTTLWGGGDGNNTDQFYIDRTLTTSELNRISFYSGIASSSFVGTAYQLNGGSFNQEIIPVPETEVWATAALLLSAAACGAWRSRGWKKRFLPQKFVDKARSLS